jgi:small GTP-binding protein
LLGQEKYRSMTASYYRGLAGAVIMFDVTNVKSFQNVQRWLEDINKQAPTNVVRILAGNKIDLPDRKVTESEAQQLASENDIFYVETSAKDNINVNSLFELLVDQILASQSRDM